MINRFTSVVALICICFLLVGCGDDKYQRAGTVKLKGRLHDNGKPLFVEGLENATGMIKLGFHPIIEGKPIEEVTSARANLDGDFELVDGLEPGEYLITVSQYEPYPDNDLLKGKFGSRNPRKSPIRKTIEEDTELDIDLSKPEG